jgi:hypothetical protein
MSTAHNGPFCTLKDKMMLGRGEAKAIAGRMSGMQAYKCDTCKTWHVAHRQPAGTARVHRNNADKKARKKKTKGFSKRNKWIP